MGKKRNISMDESQDEILQQSSYGNNKYARRSSDPFDLPEEFAMIAAQDAARKAAANGDGQTIVTDDTAKKEKVSKKRQQKVRSKHYHALKKQLDSKLKLNISDAVTAVLDLSKESFDSSIELNLVSKKDSLSGNLTLPHGTGKQKKVVIFNDDVLKQIEDKKIDFDVLVAKPEDMGKLARFAKILGPKGLMPNPKNGTITKDPEKALDSLGGNTISYKTEKKAPLIHLVVGKRSFGADKLSDNLKAVFATLNPKQLKSAALGSSMSPAVKLDLERISL